MLRRKGVVTPAVECKVLYHRCAATCVRNVMLDLEEASFTTALPIGGDIGTAATITPVKLASDLRGNVPAPERLDTRSNPSLPSLPLFSCRGPR